MTFRELFSAEHGYDISDEAKKNGIYPCPSKFGYEAKNPTICRRLLDCKSCWEREIPNAQPVKDDSVNHPSHYTKGGIECIDAIESATHDLTGAEAVLTGQVIKYLWRWKWKNGTEDLQKAKWYLDRLIEKVQKEVD
jgi:hypothetical protein